MQLQSDFPTGDSMTSTTKLELDGVCENARNFARSPAGSNLTAALRQVIAMIDSLTLEGDSLDAQSGAEAMRLSILAMLGGLVEGWQSA